MTYKLYYFNSRGLAEPIRMIFAYGGVEYEDIRIPIPEKIVPNPIPTEIKEKCTWGQVPLIEFDGRKLAQSLAITRYFAKKFDLVGSNEFEAAQCDELVDTCREIFSSFTPLIMMKFEKDEEKLAEKLEEIKPIVREKYLSQFELIVKNNGGKYTVGKKLSWADIYLAHVLNNVEIIYGIKFVDEYPNLKTVVENVLSTPQIKKWIESRPTTTW